MSPDELTALLQSRKWVKRRVDRVEFLDLTTVRRTIVFTLDLEELARLPPGGWRRLIPLGWFVPWANAGAELLDADGRVLPYLTSQESDKRIEGQIKDRLAALKATGDMIDRVKQIRLHRKDAGRPGFRCVPCDERGFVEAGLNPGYAQLMNEKWGCRAARELLHELHRRWASDPNAKELAEIVLAWQTNFVLLARLDASRCAGGSVTLQLSFDQELRGWEPPWERRKLVLKCDDLTGAEAKEWRRHISRGGPFDKDLDELFPRGLDGFIARRKWPWLRGLGRRGLLGLAWHVAWHQASGLDTPSHQVDVILPNELTAVRMRMLRTYDGEPHATVADQVGSRATIVAPDVGSAGDGQPPATSGGNDRRPPEPTLFSLVITQRSPASWYGGVWIALLTSVAILTSALLWLPDSQSKATDGITMLVVAPTLVATLLSVRARSEIAEQLTRTLRRLIGAVGVLAAICAIGLLAQRQPSKGSASSSELLGLKVLWIAIAVLLAFVALALSVGACRIRRLIAAGRRASPRVIADPKVGKVLNLEGAPRIPPPDRWLAADEGELVPWGWLSDPRGQRSDPHPPYSDRCFWQDTDRTGLVEWVQEIFHYKGRGE